MSYKRTAHIMTILEEKPYYLVPSYEVKNEECSICLSLFSEKKCVEMKRCNHMYHQDCIEQSLKRNQFCPLCRKDVYENDSTIKDCCILL